MFVIEGKNNAPTFVDKDCRVYENFEDYKSHNKLPRGPMIYPRDGTYTPEYENDGRVVLQVGETPSAGIFQRTVDVCSAIVMVGGMALSVTGVVTFFAPSMLTQTVAKVMQYGSFALSGCSILG